MNRKILVILLPVVLLSMATFQVRSQDDESTSSRWGANYFPDYELTNQAGEKVRFFSDLIEDKIVVINFIYTSCPDTCPLETSRLREIYSLLEERMGKDIFFYSISIDPDHDTVAVLKDYAERWEVGPGWSFLTGNEAEINHLRKKLGLLSKRDSVNLAAHQVNMIMGNQKTGRWIHRTPFDSAVVLTEHLGRWLNNYRNTKEKWNDYAEAPELRQVSGGEYIFRTRCASCHTIGGGEVTSHSPAVAGPDLLGVGKRRDPEWLARWIREPDVMLAEKDALAVAMQEQYKGVVMPNFRLSETDVSNVVEFIEKETELHLNGYESEMKEVKPLAISGNPKVKCPNCAKEEVPEMDLSLRDVPRKWSSERRINLPANSSDQEVQGSDTK